MTAQSADRSVSVDRWSQRDFTLTSGKVAYRGAVAAIKLGTGEVVPGTGASDELPIGRFARFIDATSAAKSVPVALFRDVTAHWFVNGDSMVATDIGATVYLDDDQTALLTSTGGAVTRLGMLWAVDSVRGVLVEPFPAFPIDGLGTPLVVAGAQSFVSNDLVLGASPTPGTIYAVPTTGAASTVTLPATATEGTIIYFQADGTANGHTVQYRDATGPTNLTTALTALKRHLVVATFLGGNWAANAYVSP